MQCRLSDVINRKPQNQFFLLFSLKHIIFSYSYQDLQDQYLSLQTYADDLRREVKSLEKHVDDLTKRHREELKAQVSLYMKDMFT